MGTGFPTIYNELLLSLLSTEGTYVETNERTGEDIFALRKPFSFTLDLTKGKLPMTFLRKTYPATAAKEIAWFISGSNEVKWLEERGCKIWSKFAEEDGTINGAYGFRWRHHFQRDQLLKAIEALTENSTDRQIFISNWDPNIDGLGNKAKATPCPIGFTVSIAGGRLNMTLLMRSSDVFVGLPYDVMGHAILLKTLADQLQYYPGYLHVTLAHPHLYEKHVKMLEGALKEEHNPNKFKEPHMPLFNVTEVVHDPDKFIRTWEQIASHYKGLLIPDLKPELIL